MIVHAFSKKRPIVYKDGGQDYNGSDFIVSLSWTAEAKIPEEAYIEVIEIQEGTDLYELLLSQARESMTTDAVQQAVTRARFFDIKILVDNETEGGTIQSQEIQPAVPISVNITYQKPVETVDPDGITVVHFEDDGQVTEIDSSIEKNNSEEVTAVDFEADGFSVYGFMYTVDFTYENYTYSIEGEDEILLSALFEKFGITKSASDTISIEFTNSSMIADPSM